MSRYRDDELDDLFADDPELGRLAGILAASELRQPPLDPTFKHDLRRRVMHEAFDHLGTRSRAVGGGGWRRIFGAPRLATAAIAVAAFLLVFVIYPSLTARPAGNTYVRLGVDSTRPVAVNQPIVLEFNQPMDHASVEKTVKLEPATQVTYQWQGNSLLISPVAGNLAGNTQYHVTVPAQARTADNKALGKPADITFVTQPQPSPAPAGSPSPTPLPTLAVTSDFQVATGVGTLLGWSPDGARVFVLTTAGDLLLASGDGSISKALAHGVRSALVGGDGSVAVNEAAGWSVLSPQGGRRTPNGTPFGWRGSKLLVTRGTGADLGLFAEDATTPLVERMGPPELRSLSPDGNWLVTRDASGGPASALNLDTKATLPLPAGHPSFAPDSSRVATRVGSDLVFSSVDGSAPRAVALTDPGNPVIAWFDHENVLVVGRAALVVKTDGTIKELASPAVAGARAISAPGDGRHFAYLHEEVARAATVGTGATASLKAGDAVVDQFETARVAGDAKAASALVASAARTGIATPVPGLTLKRYYIVASGTGPGGDQLSYVVRLVFANPAGAESRFIDESLTLEAQSGGDIKIAALNSGPWQPLGSGPTVISVQRPAPGVIQVYFDSDLDPATVAAGVSVTSAGGAAVPATTSYGRRVVTITADSGMIGPFAVQVTADLKDVAGNSATAYRVLVLGSTGPLGG